MPNYFPYFAQDNAPNPGGTGNPGTVYNSPQGQPYMGGQSPNLGRYQPPTMDSAGGWSGQGGYSYNLPNAFGPYPFFTQSGFSGTGPGAVAPYVNGAGPGFFPNFVGGSAPASFHFGGPRPSPGGPATNPNGYPGRPPVNPQSGAAAPNPNSARDALNQALGSGAPAPDISIPGRMADTSPWSGSTDATSNTFTTDGSKPQTGQHAAPRENPGLPYTQPDFVDGSGDIGTGVSDFIEQAGLRHLGGIGAGGDPNEWAAGFNGTDMLTDGSRNSRMNPGWSAALRRDGSRVADYLNTQLPGRWSTGRPQQPGVPDFVNPGVSDIPVYPGRDLPDVGNYTSTDAPAPSQGQGQGGGTPIPRGPAPSPDQGGGFWNGVDQWRYNHPWIDRAAGMTPAGQLFHLIDNTVGRYNRSRGRRPGG